ncbi:MAG: glycosyltransferase family 4 protein, partial [Candidatus Methylomirabilales bacterium]
MRIALVRQRYQVGGGAERSLESLMAELIKEGHDVHLFTNRWDATKLDGVTFHRVPIIKGLSFLKVLSFAAFSYLQLKRMNFDIIHSFERTLYQDIYRAGDGCHREWLIQRHRAAPWRRALDAVNPLHRSILFLERRLFAPGHCLKIIANSRKVREEIIHHYGFPSDCITLVYNGVDLMRFHPLNRKRLRSHIRRMLGLDPEDLVLLFVGSGFERKGLKVLIEGAALTRGAGRDLTILVAGKGNPKRYLALAERLGFSGRLRFLGVWPNVEELYAAADTFLLPTLYDPFANTCLEAMASGLPVITTAQNGVSELIEEGRNGLIVKDPLDSGEVGEKLLELADPGRRRSMGEEARKVAEAFPLSRNVQETVKIYQEVL